MRRTRHVQVWGTTTLLLAGALAVMPAAQAAAVGQEVSVGGAFDLARGLVWTVPELVGAAGDTLVSAANAAGGEGLRRHADAQEARQALQDYLVDRAGSPPSLVNPWAEAVNRTYAPYFGRDAGFMAGTFIRISTDGNTYVQVPFACDGCRPPEFLPGDTVAMLQEQTPVTAAWVAGTADATRQAADEVARALLT